MGMCMNVHENNEKGKYGGSISTPRGDVRDVLGYCSCSTCLIFFSHILLCTFIYSFAFLLLFSVFIEAEKKEARLKRLEQKKSFFEAFTTPVAGATADATTDATGVTPNAGVTASTNVGASAKSSTSTPAAASSLLDRVNSALGNATTSSDDVITGMFFNQIFPRIIFFLTIYVLYHTEKKQQASGSERGRSATTPSTVPSNSSTLSSSNSSTLPSSTKNKADLFDAALASLNEVPAAKVCTHVFISHTHHPPLFFSLSPCICTFSIRAYMHVTYVAKNPSITF